MIIYQGKKNMTDYSLRVKNPALYKVKIFEIISQTEMVAELSNFDVSLDLMAKRVEKYKNLHAYLRGISIKHGDQLNPDYNPDEIQQFMIKTFEFMKSTDLLRPSGNPYYNRDLYCAYLHVQVEKYGLLKNEYERQSALSLDRQLITKNTLIDCECGAQYTPHNKSQHMKTLKHIEFIAQLGEM